jgi:hypothetical protein
MVMSGTFSANPPSNSRTLRPVALPITSHSAQSTQAIASIKSLRSRLAVLSANSLAQMRSVASTSLPIISGPSSSRIRRTISRPPSRLSPL